VFERLHRGRISAPAARPRLRRRVCPPAQPPARLLTAELAAQLVALSAGSTANPILIFLDLQSSTGEKNRK